MTAFYRMALSSLFFTPFVIGRMRRGAGHPVTTLDGQAASMSRYRNWWLVLPLAGGILSALDHGFWSAAIMTTRVANATLLNNMAPLWVALFAAIIWREKLRGRFWVGLVLALGGAATVLGNDLVHNPHFTPGDWMGVLSSVFYAGYYLVTQRGRTRMDALTYVWLATLACAAVLFLAVLAARLPLGGYPPHTWLSFAGAALISQTLGYFSLVYALGRLPASVVSPTMIAQPVLTALLAIPLVGESLVPWQIAGGVVVLAGVYLVNRSA